VHKVLVSGNGGSLELTHGLHVRLAALICGKGDDLEVGIHFCDLLEPLSARTCVCMRVSVSVCVCVSVRVRVSE
jgi:hypothetical protein